jgi:4-diphosphocytidyl-2-C-methyl-D-erythritol kinase
MPGRGMDAGGRDRPVTAAAEARSLRAWAKVNLFLRVLRTRDDGYHELETLIVPISLADRMVVHADADPSFRTLSLSLEVTGPADLVSGVPRDDSNLILKAAAALAERTGVHGLADIALEKVIPVGAGLGGGSADAAAVLDVLNDLWGCGLSPEALRQVGATVGSDVPALMLGGPVRAAGRGERVEPARVMPLSIQLVTFPFSVSTPDAFRWWDAHGSTGPDTDALLAAAAPDGDLPAFARLMYNDLEQPVIHRYPEIAEAKKILLEGGALGAVMSGSGPSVVGLMAGESARLIHHAELAIDGLGCRSLACEAIVSLPER